KSLRTLQSDPGDSDAVVVLFEGQLRILQQTIEILKTTDGSTVEKILTHTKELNEAMDKLAKCQSFDDIVTFIQASNFGEMCGAACRQLEFRSQAYKGE